MFRNHNSPTSMRHMRGSALVIALFIIVVMALVGAGMVRIVGDSSQSVVSDVIGHRASNAARSGAEQFLVELFPHDSPLAIALCPPRATILGADPTSVSSGSSYNFDQPGLLSCSAQVFCDHAVVDSTTHLRILSQGTCVVDGINYSKQLILEASDVAL